MSGGLAHPKAWDLDERLRDQDERYVSGVVAGYLAGEATLAEATRAVREFVKVWGLHPMGGGWRWRVDHNGELCRYKATRRA